MTLEVEIEHPLDRITLSGRFRAEDGVTALFGRSGAGKSSVLAVVAGLLRPRRARVVVGGTVLVDTEAGVWVPPHRRRLGYVFQDALLFPHLSVAGNLRYGAWFRGGDARREGEIVELLGIGNLLRARPHALSGGERQRVAIGRALLASPRLLLMDEPLSALDEARKHEILPYLERLRDAGGVPILLVSHSVADVARLATTVVHLADGRIDAVGSPAQVFGGSIAPTADGGGVTVLDGEVRDVAADGLARVETAAGPFYVGAAPAAGTRLRVLVDPADVIVAIAKPEGLSALNVLPAVVLAVVDVGSTSVALRLGCGEAEIVARLTRRSAAALALTPGRAVWAVVKTVAIDRGSA